MGRKQISIKEKKIGYTIYLTVKLYNILFPKYTKKEIDNMIITALIKNSGNNLLIQKNDDLIDEITELKITINESKKQLEEKTKELNIIQQQIFK